MIKESYKQQRHDDDLNQPLSVQPWGRDGDKRRYWLIEGQDDTHFRLYRESNPALKKNTWRSVAGSIEELKQVADNLGEEGSQAARRLKERIMLAIPRFEASEEVCANHQYALRVGPVLRDRRNANGVTTATPVKHNSRGQSRDSPYTKDARAASG